MRDALNPVNHKDHEGNSKGGSWVSFVLRIFTPENIWAFVLFLLAVLLIIFTTDSSPVWIYQGF
jgi:hypothetical protein